MSHTLPALVEHIGLLLGRDLAERGGFAQGSDAVSRVADVATGEQFVVKHWPTSDLDLSELEERAKSAGTLRDSGWPIPEPALLGDFEGATFTVDPLIDGDHPSSITPEILTTMLQLAASSRAIGPSSHSWRPWLIDEVAGARRSPIAPPVLEAHRVGRTVLDALRSTAQAIPDTTHDVVHGDFSPGNVLIRDGAVVAVIDWQRARPGDAAFDLVNLEFDLILWGRGVAEHLPLVRTVLASSPRTLLTFYRAYYSAWNLTWSIGTDDERAVIQVVELLLDH